MTLDEAIKNVESLGLFWAIEGGPGIICTAVVQRTGEYIGDELAYPGAECGKTPAEALMKALLEWRSSHPETPA